MINGYRIKEKTLQKYWNKTPKSVTNYGTCPFHELRKVTNLVWQLKFYFQKKSLGNYYVVINLIIYLNKMQELHFF